MERPQELVPVPRSVGAYRIRSYLGTGGMGEVYQAWDERLKRRVAVKRIRTDVPANDARRIRFRHEARLAARLNHPSIVQIFDIVQLDAGDWIVMEYVEGECLSELIRKRGALEPAQTVDWARQVAEGLAAAHAKGIVHRDLKTENVMVTWEGTSPAGRASAGRASAGRASAGRASAGRASAGRAKILDFGVAKPLVQEGSDAWDTTSISTAGAVVGTVRAMSPEQACGRPVGPPADLHALGVLIYEMHTGVSPFLGTTAVETMKALVSRPHEPLASRRSEGTPEALARLVDRLLEKSPELRPARADEVALELARIGESLAAVQSPEEPESRGVPIAEAPTLADEDAAEEDLPSPAVRGVRAFRGRPSRRALAVAGVLIAVAGSAWTFRSRLERGPDPATASVRPAPASATPYQRGMALLERYDLPGAIDRAIEIFEKAAADDPESASAHAGLARALVYAYREADQDARRLELALAEARRAVELDRYLAAGHTSLGLALAHLKRDDEAMEAFAAALVLDPGDAVAEAGRGDVHLRRGELEEAARAYRAAIALDGANRYFHDALGTACYRAGRWQEAAEAFRRSIELAPDSVFGYRNLSAVYFQLGRWAEAAAELQKAIAVRPNPSLYTNLGTLLFYQGLYSPAAEAFEAAIAAGGAGADTHLNWANLGDAYRFEPGRGAEAREAFRRALRLLEKELGDAPADGRQQSRRALYLAKLGEREAALAELDGLAGEAGRTPAILHRITVAYEILGERDRAFQALELELASGQAPSAVENDPELSALRADPRFEPLMSRFGDAGRRAD